MKTTLGKDCDWKVRTFDNEYDAKVFAAGLNYEEDQRMDGTHYFVEYDGKTYTVYGKHFNKYSIGLVRYVD